MSTEHITPDQATHNFTPFPRVALAVESAQALLDGTLPPPTLIDEVEGKTNLEFVNESLQNLTRSGHGKVKTKALVTQEAGVTGEKSEVEVSVSFTLPKQTRIRRLGRRILGEDPDHIPAKLIEPID